MEIFIDNDKQGLSIVLPEQDNLTSAFRLNILGSVNVNFENDIDKFTGIDNLGVELKQKLEALNAE